LTIRSSMYPYSTISPSATAAMQQAIDLEPAAEINYDHLAQILFEGGRYTDAYVVVRKAVDLAPGSAQAYKLKGHIEARLGLFKQDRKSTRLNYSLGSIS